ncbi:hypothetical protein ACCAA_760041 [Candidatus Accumulibacter aalborgensis]|uniref:HTH asnC-type domain-containing protein n=1 Tax=Candidatus Accumulibacter aalborgensis TaxID=1860102 RepID=A0A1A8Y0A6_9PROT|nr:hypothetical protein ACCAA_760041 [Candidatus Accumulibacter aalborgensis]
MSKITIDRYDLALLDALQRKGNATNATLGEQIRLSASQISRRIQRLEEDGVIAGYVAMLAPSAVGLWGSPLSPRSSWNVTARPPAKRLNKLSPRCRK